MTQEALFAFVKEGGAYCAPLLLLAIFWLEVDRRRLLKSLSDKDETIASKDAKIESLAERVIEVATAVRTFLFSKGSSSH
jgi:hypothetical protein